MSIAKNDGRQSPLVASVDFGFADFASGVLEAAVELPAGAIVQGGNLVITEAFNSLTSDTLTVGDAAAEDRYAAGINGTAAALTALVPTGLVVTGIDNVTLTWTGVGTAPTAGAGTLTVEYIVPGRAQATQGN